MAKLKTWAVAQCEVCKKGYDSKRASSKYCGAKCRKLAFLKNNKLSVPELSVPELSVPDKALDLILALPEEQPVWGKSLGVNDELDDTNASQEPRQSTISGEVIPNYGQPDCDCQHCQTNRANGNKHVISHGRYKPARELADKELNRVPLPGDPNYKGCCYEQADGTWAVQKQAKAS